MRNMVRCLTASAFLALAPFVCIMRISAQDELNPNCAKEVACIIKRHIEASGGREALLQLASITRIGVIEFFGFQIGQSEKFSYHTDIIYPDKLREELVGNRILVDRGTDGANYWEWTGAKYEAVNDMNKRKSMTETTERANRDILWLTEEISDLKISYQTPDWANGSVCLESSWQKSLGFICFDRKTGLMSAKGNNDEYRLFFDWTRVKRIMLPFRLSHFNRARKAYEIVLSRADVDQPTDSSRFKPPHTGSMKGMLKIN